MAQEQVAEKTRGVSGKKRPVTLVTRLEKVKTVAVSGDFNDWAPTGIPMEKDGQGEWCLTFKLQPGEYHYRLLVDGQWHDHPEAKKRVPNPFGSDNCVLSVG